MHPLVSIVIPCYRQAHYLSQAIESALAQSYPRVEAVVVNDGSDDDTDRVAECYAGRILYITKTNGGLPSARNAGIRAASGKYLHFLDADDILHQDSVATLVTAMERTGHPLGIMGFKVFSELCPVQQAIPVMFDTLHHLLPALICGNFAPPHAFLVRKDLVVEVGMFREELCSCEDWDLWLRLAFRGAEVLPVPIAGAYYRHTPGSMSTNRLRMLRGRTDTLLHAGRKISENELLLNLYGMPLYEALVQEYRRWNELAAHRPKHDSDLAAGGPDDSWSRLHGFPRRHPV